MLGSNERNRRTSGDSKCSCRFDTIIEMASEGIWTIDSQGLTDFINKKGAEILGYTPEEMLGRPISDFVFEEDKSKVEGPPNMIKQGTPGRIEVCWPRKDGTAVWLLVSTTPLIGEDGSFQGVLAMATDITEQKRTELALREREIFLRGITDNAKDAIFVKSIDGRMLMANPAYFDIMGLSSEEVIGKVVGDYHHPEVARRIDEDERRVLSTGKSETIEEKVLTKNGWRMVNTTKAPYRDSDGHVIGYIGISRDVTERQRAEDALRESEERFRTLAEASPAAVTVYRGGGHVYVNEAAEEILGYSKEELLSMDYLAFIHPDDHAIVESIKARRMNGYEEPIRYEVKIITKSGEVRWAGVSSRQISYGGSPAGLVIFFDVTKQKQIEEALRRSNADLQSFAYAVSHDLKQPLSNITSYLELLLDRYAGEVLDEKALQYIGHALTGSLHMAEIVDSLLQFSRVSQSGEQYERTDMSRVLEQVKENLATSIVESGATITSGPLPIVTAAPQQMVQVLQNLIANAIKFRGPQRPEVHVSAQKDDGAWQFAVRDNGIGIDPQYNDRLFKMFSRLHAQEEYEGTGIGLALVKRIVERHGGRVWFESELGKGSTFFFTIPS
jgi:PAS domain S-box-containing protein